MTDCFKKFSKHVIQSLEQMAERVQSVTELFRDTLMYSQKTYFVAEINHLKKQNMVLA